MAYEDIDKAETLNKQYTSVFTREDTNSLPNLKAKPIQVHLNINITKDSILKKLKNLRTDKSPGPDMIHPRILKEMAELLCAPLHILYCKSLASGEVPSQWKLATVTPIFKKGKKSNPANYRPVSLTSIPCKIMERLVAEAITSHLKTNCLQCLEQHGFCGCKSTVTNLLEAMDVWTEALSHNLPVDVLFLDYAKAFDTVPHERLLKQLETFGISGNYLKWIRNFLTGRQQRVNVNGHLSSWTEVISGVPQGSVMGPLLFTLFVSDIPELINSCISMFADDTKIYRALTLDSDDEHHNLQQDLDQIQTWATTMCMQFHPEKCKVMHLGSNNQRNKYHMVKQDGTSHTLTPTEEEKDLGVLIDQKLSFSSHAQTQANKANRILGTIRHTFKALDKEAFLLLYKSLVRPHLEYASPIWHPHLKRDKDTIERIQRRATSLVNNISHLSYPERLAALQLPTLEFRRQRSDIIQTFKILNGLDHVQYERKCKICNNQMLCLAPQGRTRGHNLKLHVQHHPGARASYYSSRVTKNWNKLRQTTVEANTLETFKQRLAVDWKNHPDQYNYRFSY
jgi:hypothetical protein